MESYQSLPQADRQSTQFIPTGSPMNALNQSIATRDDSVVAPAGHELAEVAPGSRVKAVATRHIESFSFFCDACGHVRQTQVCAKLSLSGWLLIIAMVLAGLWPCVLIPCFTMALKDYKHTCTTCKNAVAIKEALT